MSDRVREAREALWAALLAGGLAVGVLCGMCAAWIPALFCLALVVVLLMWHELRELIGGASRSVGRREDGDQ